MVILGIAVEIMVRSCVYKKLLVVLSWPSRACQILTETYKAEAKGFQKQT